MVFGSLAGGGGGERGEAAAGQTSTSVDSTEDQVRVQGWFCVFEFLCFCAFEG